jgi:hypothetical protein
MEMGRREKWKAEMRKRGKAEMGRCGDDLYHQYFTN